MKVLARLALAIALIGACPHVPVFADSLEKHRLREAQAAMDTRWFHNFARTSFGAFNQPLPLWDVAAQLAARGFEPIGPYRDYLVFYRANVAAADISGLLPGLVPVGAGLLAYPCHQRVAGILHS